MNELSSNELLIEGKWISSGNKVTCDEACERIEWLVSEVLNKIGTDESGWETLFQDPKDKRFWVLFYPQSELHGGGPPSLRLITEDEAELKFNARKNT